MKNQKNQKPSYMSINTGLDLKTSFFLEKKKCITKVKYHLF